MPFTKPTAILVCIDSHPKASVLLRVAANRAKEPKTGWVVLYVETPEHYRLDKEARERVLRTLTMAEEMGGKVVHHQNESVIEGIKDTLAQAQERGNPVSHIIVGHNEKDSFWANLKVSFAERLARHLRNAPIEVHIVPLSSTQYASNLWEKMRGSDVSIRGLLFAVFSIACAYGAAEFLKANTPVIGWHINKHNFAAFFLLACVISSMRFGLLPGLVSAIFGFVVINYFYISPLRDFSITHSADSISLIIFLLAALIVSFLGAHSRATKEALARKERRSQALYEIHRLSNLVNDKKEALELLGNELSKLLEMEVAFFLPSTMQPDKIELAYPLDAKLSENDTLALQRCWNQVRTSGLGTLNRHGSSWRFEPLITSNGETGVLGIKVPPHIGLDASFGRLLMALADQAANILERIDLTRLMSESRVSEEREKLRAMLLSSVSHDLKTPLASIIGLLSVYQRMQKVGRLTQETADELTETALEEAQRLDSFISNILDMTRIESGDITFKYEWCNPLEPVLHVQKRLRQRLKNHELIIHRPAQALEVKFDLMMTEHVLQNVIDNAAKYAPSGTKIEISCSSNKKGFSYIIRDYGPGIPERKHQAIFDKYERLRQSDSKIAGTGLGLAIGKAVMEKQDGSISVRNHEQGGAEFTLYFPHCRRAKALKQEGDEKVA